MSKNKKFNIKVELEFPETFSEKEVFNFIEKELHLTKSEILTLKVKKK